jgi:hypothetical protein
MAVALVVDPLVTLPLTSVVPELRFKVPVFNKLVPTVIIPVPPLTIELFVQLVPTVTAGFWVLRSTVVAVLVFKISSVTSEPGFTIAVPVPCMYKLSY